jgi:tight adherence protein C
MLTIGLAAVFLALALAVVAFGVLSTSRAEHARMAELVQRFGAGAGIAVAEPADPFNDRVVRPLWTLLIRMARKLSGANVTQNLQRRLDLAGNPARWNVERVLACKGLGLLGFGAVGVLVGHRSVPAALLVGGIGCAIGFFLPNVLLYNVGFKRQEVLQKSLADALDLLVISVQAGLGFDAALAQVAKNTTGPLAGEFFRVLQEMQIGKSRLDALKSMGDRSTSADVKHFVGAIVQADSLGIPVSRVLHEQGKEMRTKRRQRAEELAQKVPVKILFPLILFILPALFVVILGPAGIQIVHMFGHVNGN